MPERTVYVVLTKEYEEQRLAGVYASLAAAQAAYPLQTIPAYQGAAGTRPERVGAWRERVNPEPHYARREWLNGLDGPDAVTIVECEVTDA